LDSPHPSSHPFWLLQSAWVCCLVTFGPHTPHILVCLHTTHITHLLVPEDFWITFHRTVGHYSWLVGGYLVWCPTHLPHAHTHTHHTRTHTPHTAHLGHRCRVTFYLRVTRFTLPLPHAHYGSRTRNAHRVRLPGSPLAAGFWVSHLVYTHVVRTTLQVTLGYAVCHTLVLTPRTTTHGCEHTYYTTHATPLCLPGTGYARGYTTVRTLLLPFTHALLRTHTHPTTQFGYFPHTPFPAVPTHPQVCPLPVTHPTPHTPHVYCHTF